MSVTVTKDLQTAIEALQAGKVVAYPTETFYGLGVDATNGEALRALFVLKNRPPFKPFPILLPDVRSLGKYVTPTPPNVRKLVNQYWPGALTIVLPASGLPSELMNRDGGVGFRVTGHPLASKLVKGFGGCITTTSANPGGKPSARTATEVVNYFRNADLCVLDGGSTPGGQASTVIELSGGNAPKLLRSGPISWEEIESTIGTSSRSR
ncbi:MAG: L-threonylcarbamoyladenylate synthase [Pseudomonadota bacterium]